MLFVGVYPQFLFLLLLLNNLLLPVMEPAFPVAVVNAFILLLPLLLWFLLLLLV